MNFHIFNHTVSQDEIDELGHTNNTHYIEWIQAAAIAHSTAVGWPPSQYKSLGAGWVVRKHSITYIRPALLGDAIQVKTWIENIRSATSLRKYEIRNKSDNEILALAETQWAFINYTNGKPTRIPKEVAQSFVSLEKSN